jgi:hypothetical protein
VIGPMSAPEGSGQALPYATSASFNTAITARLKIVAAESPYTISQLRRQFAYDRFLARVFTVGDQSWILKGGVAMLARCQSHGTPCQNYSRALHARYTAVVSSHVADQREYGSVSVIGVRAIWSACSGQRVPAL